VKPKVIRMNRMPKTATIKVTIRPTKRFIVRLWIARVLLALTAFVLGCGCEVESSLAYDDEKDPDE